MKSPLLMNRKVLASKLDMHPETLSKRLKEIGINERQLLWPADLKLIFETIANPLYFKVTRLKLAKAFGIHPETLAKRLKELGINNRMRLSTEELKKVYANMGQPSETLYDYPEELKEIRKELFNELSKWVFIEPRKNLE